MKNPISQRYNHSKPKFIFLLLLCMFSVITSKTQAQNFEYIDLSNHVNQGFTDKNANDGKDGWTDFGSDDSFHNLPSTVTTFKDGIVSFNIIDPSKNDGKSALVLSGPSRDVFPKVSGKIIVNEKYESLFFLHTCMYVTNGSKELIKYKIRYSDETEIVFVCYNKKEIADWWIPSEYLLKAKRTYEESNRWLINTPWKNPHPNKTINWIEMQSTGNAIPILVAISGSKTTESYQELTAQIESDFNQYDETNIKIALLQIRSNPDPKWNLEKGTSFCRDAAKNNADIALFPEMYNIGYNGVDFNQPNAMKKWKEMAIREDDSFIKHFRDLAKELNMAIVITYLQDIGNDKLPRNSASLIDRHGNIVYTYAKVHTCDFSNLENATTPGDDFYVKELDTKAGPVNIGMMICYDREFPESARLLMLKGAEIILTPNACDLGDLRLSQFQVRAMENAVATVMTNYGSEGDNKLYNGHSCIFNADASHIIVADSKEDIYYGTINIKDIRKHRKSTIWGDAFRRPHKYHEIESLEVNDVFKRKDSYLNDFIRQNR